jgi:ribonuclease HI
MKVTIGQPRTRRIYILIDSSTKGTQTSKYGPSSACWAVFRDRLEGMPLRVGIIYCNYDEGPNKMFYIGVARALEDCFLMGSTNCIFEVKGDCEPVIKQLTGQWSVNVLADFYNRVKNIEKQYKVDNRGQIRYEHISSDDGLYKKIDRCAKEVHNFIKQRLEDKK